jgi:two-component system C4-dicarboxylate transport sensor histidine kinase DctB
MRRPTSLKHVGVSVAVADDHTLQELERYAELGRLSASLIHEITNPLAAALLHLEQSAHEHNHSIKRAKRNIHLLWRYVEAARQQVRQESRVGFFMSNSQLEQVKRVFMPLARQSEIKLEIYAPQNYRLYGDPVKFQQIVSNLISNAIDAAKSCPKESRVIKLTVTVNRHYMVLRVNDQGKGIAPEQLKYLFEPFYTTKAQAGQGMGIGLALVKRYVEQDFGGSIRVRSRPMAGTRFIVKLRLPQS